MALRSSSRGIGSLSGALIGALLLVVAALLFVAIYYALPGYQHFFALITIGILSLVFALVAYLAESFTREPTPMRLATFGFLGMGFAVLLLTIAFAPGSPLGVVAQLVALVLILLVLVGVLVFARWRATALGAEARREQRRQEWSAQPSVPSAFDYAAAQKAAAPPAQAPPSGGSPPSRSGGSP